MSVATQIARIDIQGRTVRRVWALRRRDGYYLASKDPIQWWWDVYSAMLFEFLDEIPETEEPVEIVSILVVEEEPE